MFRGAARRAWAYRGLLSLVALLVAVVAATSGVLLGAVTGATTDATREALSRPEPAGLVVTTRVAPDARAQDVRVRSEIEALFAGAPLVVVRSETPDGTDTPFVSWSLSPDLAALAPADTAGLAAGAHLRAVLRDAPGVAVRGVVVEGDLAERAAAVATAQRSAGAVSTVPLLLLVLAAGVALVQVARLLAGARSNEVEILVARGASPRRLAVGAFVEAGVVGVVAAGVGGAVAEVVIAGPGAAAVAVAAGLTAVGAVVVLTLVATLQARAVARRQVADRSGRLRHVAAVGTVLVVLAVAVAGMLRLRSPGSPLVVTAGGARTDLLAAVAPGVALMALGLVVVALLGPVSRAGAAVAARRPGSTVVLAARQVARRLRVVAVGVVLLVLAAGSAVLAGAFVGTSEQARAAVLTQQAGSDVRVTVPGGRLTPSAPPPRAEAFEALDGVAAAVPVLVADATVQGEPVGLTALPAHRATAVVRSPDHQGAAASWQHDDPFAAAPTLPEGSSELVLALEGVVSSGTLEVQVSVWLAGDDGTVAVVEAGAAQLTEGTSATTVTVPLGAGTPPAARLAAVDLVLDGAPHPRDVSLAAASVTATTPDGTVPVDVAGAVWATASEAGTAGIVGREDGTLGLDAALDAPERSSLRLVATGAEGAGAVDAVAAVVSDAVVERWDLTLGDTFRATTGGAGVTLRVADVVPVVPGQESARSVLVDLAALDAALLRTTAHLPRPGEVWVAVTDPDDGGAVARTATDARAVAQEQAPLAQDVEVRTAVGDGPDLAAPVREAFVLAAAGAVALAMVGLAVVAVSDLSGRRAEVAVLRAAGVGPRSQAAGRALESGAVGAAALLAGSGAGWSVAAVAVPGLVGSVLDVARPGFTVDVGLVVALVGAAAAGTAAVAAALTWRVAAQARDTGYRPEVR